MAYFLIGRSLANLIADWNKAPIHHAPVDETEIEDLVHEMEDRAKDAGQRG